MAFGDILAGFAEAGHEHRKTLLQMDYEKKKDLGEKYFQISQNPDYPEHMRTEALNRTIGLHTLEPEKKMPKEWESMTFTVPPQNAQPQTQPGAMPMGSPGAPMGLQAPEIPPPHLDAQTMTMRPKTFEEHLSEASALAHAQAAAKPVLDIGTFGEGGSGLYDKTTGKVIREPSPPPVSMQQKVGSIDNKPAVVNFNPKTGRTTTLQGEDVSDRFQPKEAAPSFEEKTYEDWQKDNPKGSRKEFGEWKASLVPSATFNINNPGGPADRVNYIADQVEADPTGLMFNRLVGPDKKLRQQVTDALQSRDSDLSVLTSSTRQLGETAHDLMPNFTEAIKMLDSKTLQNKLANVVGPRWQEFMAGKVGVGDPEIDRLRVFVSLLQSGTMRAHIGARGGTGLVQKFEKLFNSDKMDAPTLKDSLTATRDFLKRYDDAVYARNKKDFSFDYQGQTIHFPNKEALEAAKKAVGAQ